MNVKKVKKTKTKNLKGGAIPSTWKMKVVDGKVYLSYDGGKTWNAGYDISRV
jgi:hypothetical protein